MSEGGRICPICDLITDEGMCPQDNVPTVDRARLLKYRNGLEPGSVIAGRFRVDRFIGAGAMGGVYLCTQLNMQRPVALKSLKPEFMSDQAMLKRFYLEARAASQLSHPNIVRIYDFGVDEDLEIAYITMEYLEGDDLQDLLIRRPQLSERDMCGLLAQVAKALVGAHDKGIVHRDLKPGNIHVRELPGGDIQAKVLDFGIAKVLPGNMDMTSGLTDTGMTLGTPHYMSPEQVSGRSVDYRSDFYSVGCMLYEMLTGRRPFVAEDRLGLSMMHLTEPAPLLPDALVDGVAPSEPLRQIYQSLMAKKVEDRPQSTEALGRVLSSLAQGTAPEMELLAHAPVRLESSDVNVNAVAETAVGQEALAHSDTIAAAPAAPGTDTAMVRPLSATMPPAEPARESTHVLVGGGGVSSNKPYVVVGVGLAAALIAWMVIPSAPVEEPPPDTAGVVQEAREAPGKQAGAVEESQGAAAVTAPVADVVWVRVETTPPGARIREGNVTLGRSPVDVSLKVNQLERRLSIDLDGHGMEEVLLTPRTQSPMVILLTPEPAVSPAARIGPKRYPKRTKKRSRTPAPPVEPQKPSVDKKSRAVAPASAPKKKKKSKKDDYLDEVW